MLAAGEALPAEKRESEWVLSDQDGNIVLAACTAVFLLCACP